MQPVLGIDFGTSNSTVGLYQHDRVTMVPLEGAHISVPTCIFYNTEQPPHSVHFGREAQTLYREGYQGRLLRSLKSILGTSLAQESTAIGYKSLKLADVLTSFLAHLKVKAELVAKQSLEQVVIGRPVHFIDGDPTADQRAQGELEAIAQKAGFKDIRFQYEPIAAALAYEADLTSDETVLVADLGGGTADFSILHLSPKRAQEVDRRADVLGNSGVHLGGTDLDRLLSYRCVMPELGLGSRYRDTVLEMPLTPYTLLSTWHKINLLYTPRALVDIAEMVRGAAKPEKVQRLQTLVENRAGHALAHQVEAAKIALSTQPRTEIDLRELLGGLVVPVRERDFLLAIQGAVDSIVATVADLVKVAQINPVAIHTIFFTGGTSAVPALRQAICAELPHARVIDGDPVAAVGRGLTLSAAVQFDAAV